MDLKVTDILTPAAIQLDLVATDKTDVLTQLVDLVVGTGKVSDRDALLKVILDRERLMSTGIGYGVALPHGKSSVVHTSLAALAVLRTPIDFDALDDKPVNIVLLLVGTEEAVGAHLRLLSRISRMVGSDQFRSDLVGARTVEEVLDLFATYEEERAS
jgi:fructose-specific phosphotransferase system IIA component